MPRTAGKGAENLVLGHESTPLDDPDLDRRYRDLSIATTHHSIATADMSLLPPLIPTPPSHIYPPSHMYLTLTYLSVGGKPRRTP